MLARYERECRSLTLRESIVLTMGCIARTVMSPGMWKPGKCHSPWTKQGVRGRDSYDSIGIDTWGVDFVLLDQQGHVWACPLLIAIAAPMA